MTLEVGNFFEIGGEGCKRGGEGIKRKGRGHFRGRGGAAVNVLEASTHHPPCPVLVLVPVQ